MNRKGPQMCDVTENRFRTVLMLMRIAGVPINTKNASLLHTIYSALLVINGYALYIAIYADLITHNDDLKNFMKAFRILTTTSTLYWMHLNLRLRLNKFERLLRLTESFTWEDQPTRDPHTGHITLAGWIPRVQKVTKYGFIISTVFHLVQSAVRIYTSTTNELMYSAWYPFDTTSSPGYELAILLQIFATALYLGIYFGFSTLYATLVIVACSQLQKLRRNLLDIKQNLVTSGEESAAKADSEGAEQPVSRPEDGFSRMQTQLNECVQHHQAILLYMRAIEDTMNFTLCGLFLTLLATLCLASFSAVTSWGDMTDLAQIFYIYGLVMGNICVYCTLGTKLTLQAENVRDAAWGCDWVGTPVPFQRCLAFIIATANKEFTLTAGKFVPVSNETLLNMTKESISLFMFLLTMKTKNEGAVTA